MPGYCASSPQSPLRAVSACGENSARFLSGSSPHHAEHGGPLIRMAAKSKTARRRPRARTIEASKRMVIDRTGSSAC